MPGFDGTGPGGMGPRTGGGFGYCAPVERPYGRPTGGWPYGRGRGPRGGRGFGGRGRGFGGRGWGWQAYDQPEPYQGINRPYDKPFYEENITVQEEKTYLREELSYLENKMAEINKRLKELEKKEEPVKEE